MTTNKQLWALQNKFLDTTYQPCANTWKIEPVYTDKRVLLNNWREQSARSEHERISEHKKYLLPPSSHLMPTIDRFNRLIPAAPPHKVSCTAGADTETHWADGFLKDARTRPYSKYYECHYEDPDSAYDIKCGPGSQCNPVIPTKLPSWHNVNKTNCRPEENNQLIQGTHDVPELYQFTMKGKESHERNSPFPYPRQWIYQTPENHGLQVRKAQESSLLDGISGEGAPVWGHELQRNTVYRLSFKPPDMSEVKNKPMRFPLEMKPPMINSHRPFLGSRAGIYDSFQTTKQLNERVLQRIKYL